MMYLLTRTLILLAMLALIGLLSTRLSAASGSYSAYLPIVQSARDASIDIIYPTATPLPRPTAYDLPGPVRTTQNSYYTIPGANWVAVVGEVVNDTDAPVYDVRLPAQFWDSSGSIVGFGISDAYVRELRPGLTAPFKTVAFVDPGWYSYALSVTYTTASTITYYHSMTLATPQLYSGDTYVFVASTLTNTTTLTWGLPWVAASFYDDTGRIVDANVFVPTLEISPSQSIPFFGQAWKGPHLDRLASYLLSVEGVSTPTPTPTNTPTVTPTSTVTP